MKKTNILYRVEWLQRRGYPGTFLFTRYQEGERNIRAYPFHGTDLESLTRFNRFAAAVETLNLKEELVLILRSDGFTAFMIVNSNGKVDEVTS